MRIHLHLLRGLTLFGLSCLLAACGAAPPPAADAPSAVTDRAPPAPTPTEPAGEAIPETAPSALPERPTLVVQTLSGATFDLSSRRGRWVVVNFWATWCGPCLKEIPDLSAFDQSREDVEVIGLAYEEIEATDLKAFLLKHPASYDIAILDVYDPPADFDTPRGLPMTYLIAPDGKVAQKFLGPVTSQELSAAIAAHPVPAA